MNVRNLWSLLPSTLLLCCTLSGPAWAQDDTGNGKEVSGKDAADSEIVCRREAVTGSRIMKKVCFNRADMKMYQDKLQREMNRPRSTTEKHK